MNGTAGVGTAAGGAAQAAAAAAAAAASSFGPPPSPAPVVQTECRLITGPVAISAQLVLLTVVLTALFFKRHSERPRRPMNVWLLDIGKQACSAGAGHTVGMFIAILAHSRTHSASECGWYFVVYFMDCSLGLTLAITFHKLTTNTARWLQTRHMAAKAADQGEGSHSHHPWWETLVEIGHYGDAASPNFRKWAIQVVSWVLCVVCARCIVGIIILSMTAVFEHITLALDARFQGHPNYYLYAVMVCIPLVINIGQAWIQDQVLKWKSKKHPNTKREDEEEEDAQQQQQPLLPVTTMQGVVEGGMLLQMLTPNQQRKVG